MSEKTSKFTNNIRQGRFIRIYEGANLTHLKMGKISKVLISDKYRALNDIKLMENNTIINPIVEVSNISLLKKQVNPMILAETDSANEVIDSYFSNLLY